MENRPSPQGGGPGPITNTQFDVTANTNITLYQENMLVLELPLWEETEMEIQFSILW